MSGLNLIGIVNIRSPHISSVHSAHKIETNGYFFAADGVMFSFMPTVKQGIFAAYKLGGDPVIKKCYGFCSKADLQIKGL